MLGRLFKSKSLLSLGGNEGPDTESRPGSHQSSSEDTAHAQSVRNENITDTTNTNANTATNVNSYEDSYTREILYGSSELAPHPVPFNPRRFRLVISQDGGNLRTKQVLYDSAKDFPAAASPFSRSRSPSVASSPTSSTSASALPSAVSPDIPGASTSYHSPSQFLGSSSNRVPSPANTLKSMSGTPMHSAAAAKYTHNINDLNDYMFGRGLPSVERHTATKIHMLPELTSLGQGSYSAVLITKLFSISSLPSINGDSAILADTDWAPRATFPCKDAVFQVPPITSKSATSQQDPLVPSSKSSVFGSRFALGVIIPLEDANATVEEVLASNWETISFQLSSLHNLVCKKLTLALRSSMVCNQSPYISHKRISFPSGVLQSDAEFSHQLQNLVRLVHYNVNTPRLVNINAFMTHSLNHTDSTLKTNVMNWALEVINWLEFKEGKNSAAFHSQGPAIPQMHSQNSYLSHSNSSVSSWYRPAEPSVSANTFLASLIALILPLRQSLSVGPSHADTCSSSDTKQITRIVVMTSNSSVAKKLIFILSGLIPDAEFLQRLECEGGDFTSNADGTENSESGDAASTVSYDGTTKNVSTQGCSSSAVADTTLDGGISFSAKHIAAKPIPIRVGSVASDSQSDDSPSVSLSSTKGWNVPHKSSTSLSLNGHKGTFDGANVVVAQQIPKARRSSATNTSSVAYLSSSLNSSLSSSASNYSLSRLGSSFMDRWKNSLVGSHKLHPSFIPEIADAAITPEALNARPAFSGVQSPSPGDEIDEPIWEDSSVASSSGSPFKQKASRTQSLLNLLKEAPAKSSGISKSTLGVDRTRSSIYLPPLRKDESNADDINSALIGEKVKKMMQGALHFNSSERASLSVEQVEGIQPIETSSKNASGGMSDDAIRERTLHKKAYLQPNVAFVDEFRPEYTIQSCPVNPRLESQVLGTMRNELAFYQTNCGYEKVVSKTIFVSLRAREIKTMDMSVGGQKRSYFEKGFNPRTPSAAAGEPLSPYASSSAPPSPSTSYFSTDHLTFNHDKRESPGANNSRYLVRKVYTPSRNLGDKEAIGRVESQLEKLNEVAALINSNSAESRDTKGLYNRMLFNAVRELIA